MAQDKVENPVKTEEEYLNQRLIDQLEWYDRKSMDNQRQFKRYRKLEIILGALIPFLLTFDGMLDIPLGEGKGSINVVTVVVAAIGVAIVVLGGMLTLNKYEENYVGYRTAAEKLKSEKWRYQTQVTPYRSQERFDNLVANAEKILTEENNAWIAYQQEDTKDEAGDAYTPVAARSAYTSTAGGGYTADTNAAPAGGGYLAEDTTGETERVASPSAPIYEGPEPPEGEDEGEDGPPDIFG